MSLCACQRLPLTCSLSKLAGRPDAFLKAQRSGPSLLPESSGTVRDIFNECQKQLDFSLSHAEAERISAVS